MAKKAASQYEEIVEDVRLYRERNSLSLSALAKKARVTWASMSVFASHVQLEQWCTEARNGSTRRRNGAAKTLSKIARTCEADPKRWANLTGLEPEPTKQKVPKKRVGKKKVSSEPPAVRRIFERAAKPHGSFSLDPTPRAFSESDLIYLAKVAKVAGKPLTFSDCLELLRARG